MLFNGAILFPTVLMQDHLLYILCQSSGNNPKLIKHVCLCFFEEMCLI